MPSFIEFAPSPNNRRTVFTSLSAHAAISVLDNKLQLIKDVVLDGLRSSGNGLPTIQLLAKLWLPLYLRSRLFGSARMRFNSSAASFKAKLAFLKTGTFSISRSGEEMQLEKNNVFCGLFVVVDAFYLSISVGDLA